MYFKPEKTKSPSSSRKSRKSEQNTITDNDTKTGKWSFGDICCENTVQRKESAEEGSKEVTKEIRRIVFILSKKIRR